MNAHHYLFFAAFPYVALVICIIGTIIRYRRSGFSVSSLSSQFLESKKLFWGIVPFHFGLVVVFLGHLVAFLFPKTTLLWNSHPVRLIILEVTGFIFGLSVLIGLLILLHRRLTNPRIRVVTSVMDRIVSLVLVAQIVLGLWIALGYRWGSSWFAADLSPYLWSILKCSPEIQAVSAMPLVVQLHIIGAFLFVLLVPFSRLMHLLVVPLHYLWRPYQRVIWYWDRKKVRQPDMVWTQTRPRNN
jgi:nitrate reductase gamma subunit